MEDEIVEFDAVGLVRELARKAHPDAVPELIDGDDAAAIAASIEPARAAYARLREEIAREQPARVPAGGMTPAVDPDRLPSAEKIRRGIAITKR
ncbi:MAG: hypothetical protein IT334_01200 [Thermomicrobiales bacterium]|nr:hypothetical protein [Thermomicrobiales bacterium]